MRVASAEMVALEHCNWARGKGLSPRQVIESVGYPVPDNPCWDDAMYAIAKAWDWIFRERAAE